MKKFTIKIKLISPGLIGSAEGFGAIIDSDIIFDRFGIPYIPSKRIKGCLRDSAIEVLEMFDNSDFKPFEFRRLGDSFDILDNLFGKPGQPNSSPLYISNLMIVDHQDLIKWLKYLMSEHGEFFNSEIVKNYFTELREQTSIDEYTGTAKEHSLRTTRVAKKELEFEGEIEIFDNKDDYIKLLYYASLNLRYFGTRRTRGFGKIKCSLLQNGKLLDYSNDWEGLS